MEPFVCHRGRVAPLDRPDVDTDQIVPKQFLKRIERTGFGQFLFFDWRFDEQGRERPDFVLNLPRYRGATILLARRNFGCGSSREHAPWALLDYGFRAVVAPSFADIFKNNCYKNGLLPVELPEPVIDALFARVATREGYTLTIDLERCQVRDDDGFMATFPVEPFRRHCLLHGLDDIALTLQHEAAIAAYEARRRAAGLQPGAP